MAGVIVSPVSMLNLIAEIVEFPVNAGVFKKDCSDLTRRVSLLTHLVEEIKDTNPIGSTSSSSSENDWCSDLVAVLQAAKDLLISATRFQARDSSKDDATKPKRISFQFQSVSWKLEKALSNIPYDLYDISDEVRELMDLARLQLRRAMERYGSMNNSMMFTSEPTERRDGFTNVKTKVDEDKIRFAEEEKQDSPPLLRKTSSVSLAFYLLKDADTDRLDKMVHKNTEESKKADKVTIPEDFLCPVSLELMKDPVIVATGQTYERVYIQRWIDCGNLTCPKTQQKLANFTLTPNYVLRSLISRWCTEHNVEHVAMKNCGDMLMIKTLVQRLSSRSLEDRRKAVSEIRSLSKRSTENRILIAEAGAIPVLVKLLTSEDAATVENAITCVLNLSIYDNNKELIMFAGAVTSIVQVLRAGTMEARENAAATLFSLSLADENKIIIGMSGAIPALVDLLENGSPRGKKDAATALFNLCIYQGNKGRAVRAGIVTALVKMMTDSSGGHRMVDEALTILSVLACNQDAKSAIVKANTLPALIGILQTEQARNRENAASILLSLCKRDTEKLMFIGRLGVVVPLIELSTSGTERGKRKATSLLELLREACQ